MPTERDDFDAWLAAGRERGWALDAYCHADDLPPLTDAEVAYFAEIGEDQMLDSCLTSLRLVVPSDD